MTKEKHTNFKHGFTLLELLVVVLIIGILASIALPQYKIAVYKSRYNSLMALVNAMYQAEERFYMTNGDYTDNLINLDIDLQGCTLSNDKKSCTFDWGECFLHLTPANDTSSMGSAVICIRTKGLNNGYAYYFRSNFYNKYPRKCFAKDFDEDNIWNKVCKDVGAKTFLGKASFSFFKDVNVWGF